MKVDVSSGKYNILEVVKILVENFKRIVGLAKIYNLQMEEKIRKSSSYHCNENWNPSHVFKNLKIHFLQVEEGEVEES